MKNRITHAVVGGLMALGALAPAQAALVSVSGTNVIYTYDTDQFAGFGATVSTVGDSLRILLTNFSSTDTGASPGPTLRNGTFVITVATKIANNDFGNISMSEEGDYLLEDYGPGNQVASASGQFRVFNDEGPGSDIKSFTTGALTTTIDPFVGGNTTPWQASALATAVAGWSTSAVSLQIENLLRAFATGDDFSFIEKKSIIITPIVTTSTPVPVPASVWLMGTALLALVGIRRRVA
jgi:hypothetical protein